MNHATSHEMWAAIPEHVKAKRRRQYPWMSDKGIRNYLWSRRNWVSVPKDKYKCSCQKLHKRNCINVVGA